MNFRKVDVDIQYRLILIIDKMLLNEYFILCTELFQLPNTRMVHLNIWWFSEF